MPEKLELLEIIRAEAEAYTYPIEEQELLQELKTIKQQVLYILGKYPQSRNNDFYLQWLWLKTFPKISLPWLEWEKFCKVSGKPQTVTRMRRRIQNEEGKFLPTDPEVLRARKKRSEAMKKALKRV